MKQTTVDIVIPAYYKEAPTIIKRIEKQINYYQQHLKKYRWQIVIANNGPRKDVIPVIKKLIKKHKKVTYTDIDTSGRGGSLRYTWLHSKADILIYMDADLATNLNSLLPMISLLETDADLVTGSRYVPGANVQRTFIRLFISRVYNGMLNIFLGVKIADSQCGFKGIRKETAQVVIPYVKDNFWFFDTEIMFVAKKMGYRVKEIPVEWHEQEETSVKLVKVSLNYIKNIIRLRFSRKPYLKRAHKA